jgi:hypothetical protein
LPHDAWRMSLQLCWAFACDNAPWKTSNSMSVLILFWISFFEVKTTFIYKIPSPRMKRCNAKPHDGVAWKFLAFWAEARERVLEILARRKMRVVTSFKR